MSNKLFSFLIPIIVAGVSYIVVDNIIISLTLFVVYFLYFWFIGMPRLRAYHNRLYRHQECYHFINAFVLSLSVKATISAAFEVVEHRLNKQLVDEIKLVNRLDTFETLTYLNNYFQFKKYELFLRIIDLYIQQGGDVLDMFSLLLANARHEQSQNNHLKMISQRKLNNFVILWLLTIIVAIFARFSINELYVEMLASIIFQFGFFIYFIFMLYSIHRWITLYRKVNSHE
jgi:hypothetical protein